MSIDAFGNRIVGQVNEVFVIFNEKKNEFYAEPRSMIDGPLKNAVAWKTYKEAYRSAEVQDLRVKGYSWEEIEEWEKKRVTNFRIRDFRDIHPLTRRCDEQERERKRGI